MSILQIIIHSINRKGMVNHLLIIWQHDLWNRADISKLRGSSGHDYLLHNSNLKIPLGFSDQCYRKEMFRIPQTLQVQEEYIESDHHHPPVVQAHVDGEPEKQPARNSQPVRI